MMKHISVTPLLFAVCFSFFSLSLRAGGISADSLNELNTDAQSTTETTKNDSGHHRVEQLRHLLDGVTTLYAQFSQSVYSEEGDLMQQTRGQLQAARPGKVRWQSQPPVEQLIISNGETLWIYDPDLEQVSIRPFADDVSRTPAALFIGNLKNLEDSYSISKEAASSPQTDIDLFVLSPLSADNLYSKVALGFVKDVPASMTLWDSLSQKTVITFTDVQLNQPVESTLFEFEPPEGVDIIHNE